jgi:hypothetical protein
MTELSPYEKKLIGLWKQGYSGQQIAVILQKTRGAIMGKLMRLRQKGFIDYKVEEKRFARIQDEAIRLEKERLRNDKKALNIRMIKLKADIQRLALQKIERDVNLKGIKFFDLTNKTCKYALNEGKFDQLIFCGQTPLEGRSYCQHHAQICYIPSEKRSRHVRSAKI